MNDHAQEISVAEAKSTPSPVRQAQSADMLSVIERIATSPNFNIEALNAVVALRERIQAGEAKASFDRDLSAMQPQLPTIDTNGTITVYSKAARERNGGPTAEDRPQQKTPYALMADINDAIRPALADHGFALSFRVGEEGGKIKVTGILSHREGHREETSLILQHDSTGSKNAVQAVGSSLSYGRRYATLMLLNISSRAPQDMDDDGNAAGKSAEVETIDAGEAAYVRQLLTDSTSDETKFLERIKAPSIDEIKTGDQFKLAIDLLNRKLRGAAK